MSLVEPLSFEIGRERPEPETLWTLPFRKAQELRANALSGHRRLDVELIDPFAVEDEDADGRPLLAG